MDQSKNLSELRIVLIDGVCNLCHGAVQYIVDHDPKAQFHFAPLQSELAKDLLRKLGHEQPDVPDTVVLVDHGVYYDKSAAAVRIAGSLAGPVRMLSVFAILPRFLRDAAYAFIAKRRYGWFGKTEQCRIPTPELRARFLA